MILGGSSICRWDYTFPPGGSDPSANYGKYYTNHEFSNLTNNTNDLNILHANVNGIESHFDDLQCFITDSSLKFNILCINETSQKENVEFHKNMLPNFQKPYSTG